MCVVCLAAVGLAVAVVTIGDVGFVGCLSLMLSKSLSRASHFKPSRAGVRYVVFPSLGWSSLLPTTLLYRWAPFGDAFCPAAVGVTTQSFLLAFNTFCSPSVDPRSDPFCANKSSAQWVAHSAVNPWPQFVFWPVLWCAVDGGVGVTVGVLVALFLLSGVL